jgi:hypothetical protein
LTLVKLASVVQHSGKEPFVFNLVLYDCHLLDYQYPKPEEHFSMSMMSLQLNPLPYWQVASTSELLPLFVIVIYAMPHDFYLLCK